MTATPSVCERVQLALINGTTADWITQHMLDCAECRFFKDLSRDLVTTGVAGPSAALPLDSALGAGFVTLLSEAQASGTPLDRYRLEDFLGRGGQGVVYRAFDTETHETVALKFVRCRPEHFESSAREVAHAHLVRHPNVCRVYHTERHGGVRLIVMEWIEGRRLDEALSTLPETSRLAIVRAVCEAVRAAHAAGVLHLDLKPSNILVRNTGEPVVTDFGLSTRVSDTSATEHRGGTPGYMAPEQLVDGPVDVRTDVYALGVVLRELVPRPSRRLRRVIQKAMADEPFARHADVGSLLSDLGHPARARRRMLAASALAIPMSLGLLTLHSGGAADILIVGGVGPDGRWTSSAEVFDAGRLRWTSVVAAPDPGRSIPRLAHARVVRAGSEVLLLGGGSAAGWADDSSTTNLVRAFSPASLTWNVRVCQHPCIEFEGVTYGLDRQEKDFRNRWKKQRCEASGPCMLYGRNNFVALPLRNDDVFVFGGCAGGCFGPNELYQTLTRPVPLARTAELYRRARGAWESLPPSLLPRTGAAAVSLGGAILVCGGADGTGATADPKAGPRPEKTCEQFDVNAPTSGAPPWRGAGTMPAPVPPRLAVIPDGGVLGVQADRAWRWVEVSAEPWAHDFFKSEPAPRRNQEHGALTPLQDGRVLLTGGTESGRAVPTAQAFSFDRTRQTGVWTEVAPMRDARVAHVSLKLRDGRILVAGGCSQDGRPLRSAEIYDPARDQWTSAGEMQTARCQPEGVALR